MLQTRVDKEGAYDVMAGDTEGGEGGSEPEAAIARLLPGVGGGAVDDGGTIGVDNCRALEEAQRRQRYVIGRAPDAAFHRPSSAELSLLHRLVSRSQG